MPAQALPVCLEHKTDVHLSGSCSRSADLGLRQRASTALAATLLQEINDPEDAARAVFKE
jgi:hypothetical protein